MAAKKFEDSNLAGIGSDMDKALRKAAAHAEQDFAGAGTAPGLEIWHIEKFKAVKQRDAKQTGVFYSGDAYIVLYTYTEPGSDQLRYNLHFWLGKDSTQDEQGSAAYLTVNLDDMLDGFPVQHREVQGSETQMFASYFTHMVFVDGGVASGFTSPNPDTYETKLFKVTGKGSQVQSAQVPLAASSLTNGDVFILDKGLKLIQWNAMNCSAFERRKAGEVLQKIQEARECCAEEQVYDGEDILSADEFWDALGSRPSDLNSLSDPEPPAKPKDTGVRKLYKLSNEGSSMKCKLVQDVDGKDLSASLLEEDDIMIAVANHHAFFYIGQDASKEERFAMNFKMGELLKQCGLPSSAQTTQLYKGHTVPEWDNLFA